MGGYIKETNNVDLICSDDVYDMIDGKEKQGFFGKYKKFDDIYRVLPCSNFGKTMQELRKDANMAYVLLDSVWYYQNFDGAFKMKKDILYKIIEKASMETDKDERDRLISIIDLKIDDILSIKKK